LPEVSNPDYCDKLLTLCKENHIDIIIPLIDPELDVLARRRDDFVRSDIMVTVSPLATIEMTFDKYRTWQWASQNGIAMPQTVLTIEEALGHIKAGKMRWPLVVKPRKGSASFDISYCNDEIQLRGSFDGCPEPLIQQFVEGTEYGYDLFSDEQFRPISVYCKKKLAMRAGETDKAISTNNPALIEFGKKILQAMQLFGPADVDVILSPDGPRLLEINPRFGGGYPCAHLAGANFCKKLLDMRAGKSITADIGACPEGVCMLKQDEIIRRPDWKDLPLK
jgi:carbamoyl-phosphate synthase large subunit